MAKKLPKTTAKLPTKTAETPQSTRWKFRCMITERGLCAIKKWLLKLSTKGMADLDRALEHLIVKNKTEWSRPNASPIGNSVYVIRCKDENRTQHRLFGHFHDQDGSFVITLDGFEKDNEYHPDDYKTKAPGLRDWCNQNHAVRTTPCRYIADACGDDAGDQNKFHPECSSCADC